MAPLRWKEWSTRRFSLWLRQVPQLSSTQMPVRSDSALLSVIRNIDFLRVFRKRNNSIFGSVSREEQKSLRILFQDSESMNYDKSSREWFNAQTNSDVTDAALRGRIYIGIILENAFIVCNCASHNWRFGTFSSVLEKNVMCFIFLS